MTDEQERTLRFEVVLGAAYAVLFVALVAAVTWVVIERGDLREETLRTNEIRSIENCNSLEQLKLSIRSFLTIIDADPVVLEAARHTFRPIPGGSFINERGARQWRGCGEFPEPVHD